MITILKLKSHEKDYTLKGKALKHSPLCESEKTRFNPENSDTPIWEGFIYINLHQPAKKHVFFLYIMNYIKTWRNGNNRIK